MELVSGHFVILDIDELSLLLQGVLVLSVGSFLSILSESFSAQLENF